jgi:acyl-CoA dehydrogenase
MKESGELERFRQQTRHWLEENCPPSMRTPFAGDHEWVWGGRRATFLSEDAKLWLERMGARGWTAPTWPARYGGGGLSAPQAKVLAEELRRIAARDALKSFGLWMLGPVLLEYGNEAQKLEHLPKIVRGEIRWCQGYSEPGAGSDLASLQTRAVLEGDQYVVNGQKVWTSHADKSDWMFCLVRTDPDVPKHDGISFLLIDMASPGVSVRPIKLISGASPFCESFFDDVRVPARNLVGAPGGGWTIAKALLAYERSLIASSRDARDDDEEPLEGLARRYLGLRHGVLADPALRDRITQVNMDSICNRLTLRRAAEAVQAGRQPGPESSMFKLYGTELSKRKRELKVLVAGFRGIGWDDDSFTSDELQLTRDWLRSRASSIEGGTSEVQLNIIAKRVLGLPE